MFPYLILHGSNAAAGRLQVGRQLPLAGERSAQLIGLPQGLDLQLLNGAIALLELLQSTTNLYTNCKLHGMVHSEFPMIYPS